MLCVPNLNQYLHNHFKINVSFISNIQSEHNNLITSLAPVYLSFVLAGTHVSIVHKVLVTDTLLIHIGVMLLIIITGHFN